MSEVYDVAEIPPQRRGPPAPTWPEREGFFESVKILMVPLTIDERERVLNKIIAFHRS